MSIFQRQQADQLYQQPKTCLSKLFAYLPSQPNMKYACISFIICAVMLFASMINLFSIVLAPATFVTMFTIAILAGLSGLAFFNGPQAYMNKIFEKQFLVRTVTLFGSMFLALWFSIFNKSYILSIIFCIIEFNAILLYFCNTFPAGTSLQQAKNKAMAAGVRS